MIAHHVDAHGGWTALAHALTAHLGSIREAPHDPATVEKGLRRLARRARGDGGQYGRWVLRFFGLPPMWSEFLRRFGQYHHRFTDLPTGVCHEQLAMWDRPPIVGSPAEAWIHVGMASVLSRMGDLRASTARLARARACADRAGPMAVMEVRLLEARTATDAGDRARADSALLEVERVLATSTLAPAERHPYFARLAGQRAYHLMHPVAGESADVAGALTLFDAIPADTGIPFVDFRRAEGQAACHHELGDPALAMQLAKEAADHAADGGFVRLRVLALKLASRIAEGTDDDDARALGARARRLAAQLHDEDLVRRTANVPR